MSLRRWVRSPHWMLIFVSLVYSRRKRSSPTLTAGPHNAGGWGRGDLDSDRTRAAGDGVIWILTEAFSRVSYAPSSRVDCHAFGIAVAL